MKRTFLVMAMAIALAMGVFAQATALETGGGTAVRASTVEFDDCEAKFVRAASGIVNETERVCGDGQNGWIDADVWLQFRPLDPDARPNPTCDARGLVTSFEWTSNAGGADAPLADYLPADEKYNACVYLVPANVVGDWVGNASGSARWITIESQMDGDLDGIFGVGSNPDTGETGTITGTVVGQDISMTYERTDTSTDYEAYFEGTIAPDGNSMSGTWTDSKSNSGNFYFARS